jgi:hypothetical protein
VSFKRESVHPDPIYRQPYEGFRQATDFIDDPKSSILHEMARGFNEAGLADNFFRLMDESGRSLFTEGSDGSLADTEGSVLEMLNKVAHRLLQCESQHEGYLATIVHQLVDELDKQRMYGNNEID